jgi:hypothetical protein
VGLGFDAMEAYMTVLFFSLYLACIWSIRGTWLCRVSFVVLSHRRAGVKVGLRVRGTLESDRAHEAHVQELNARSEWFRSGDAKDIAGYGLQLAENFSGVMRASKFAAGIYRFGTPRGELGSFLSKARDVIFDITFRD